MDSEHADQSPRGSQPLNATVVHLFAGPFVTVGTERRDVPEGSKQLLAFVALRGRQTERRRVAGTLWPLADEERAAGNLRSALWRLRRARINAIMADKWSLSLGEHVQVDLHDVQHWAARLIAGRPAGPDLAIPPLVAAAVDLMPGCYEDWLLLERERVRQRILHALEALSERLAAEGRFADAIEAAMLATGVEPLRESAHRTLIRVHVAEGNLTEARRSYLAYRTLLHRELGVVPSPNFASALGISAERVIAGTEEAESVRADGFSLPG